MPVGSDLRHAIRSLGRSPGFTLAALLTLALGIGATTAVFTLVDRVAIRPLPYATAGRLVDVGTSWPKIGTGMRVHISPADYFYFRSHARTLEDIAIYQTDRVNVTGNGAAELVPTVETSASIFHVLGVRPALGRLLNEQDDRPSEVGENAVAPGPAEPVVVLSHDFWVRRYGGDPAIVGRTIQVEGRAMPVVGVLPARAQLPELDADLWLPLGLNPAGRATNWHTLKSIALLRRGATVEAAQRELDGFRRRFVELFPSAYSDDFMRSTGFHMDVRSLREIVLGGVGRALWVLLGAVALVLLIACANVANLFLVRAAGRQREVAVRRALGADRRRLAGHYVTESLVLSLAGGALGALLAWGGLRLLLRLSPSWLPRLEEIHMDAASLGFALGVAVLAGTLFGLFPLLRVGAPDAVLRGSGRSGATTRRQHAFRRALIVAQMALSLVLLAAAGLMVRSFVHLRAVDPGMKPRGVVAIGLVLPQSSYGTYDAVARFYRALTARVEALPGVTSAGLVATLPLSGEIGCNGLAFESRPGEDHCVGVNIVSPGAFRALGIDVRGRVPDWDQAVAGRAGVVVSPAFARRFWPGQDPVGQGVRGNGRGPVYYPVVGVTGAVRYAGLDQPAEEMAYFPMVPTEGAPLWNPPRWLTLVVRTGLARPTSVVPLVRRTLAALDPGIPVADVTTMDEVIARSTARWSFALMLLGVAAAMALVLSVVGLYGVIAYLVADRTPEIGIRMALGARVGQVTGAFVAQSARMAALGILLGLAAALLATRALRSLLFDVSATDPLTLSAVAALLLAVALLASWLPARRAARVDPARALRTE